MRSIGRGLADRPGLDAVSFALSWTAAPQPLDAGFDLAIFDQGAWQICDGRDPHLAPRSERHVLADHFSPVLLVFGRAVQAWRPRRRGSSAPSRSPSAPTVLPMRALARDLQVPERWATAFVVLSPTLLAAAFFDFHPSALAIPWIGVSVLASQRDDTRLAAIAGVLVVLARADLGIVLLGVAIISRPRARRPFLVIGLLGAAAGALVPELMGNPGTWDAYFGHLGSGPLDAITHPWRILDALATRQVGALLLGWLLAVSFLAILRPRWVAAVVVGTLPYLLNRFPGPTLPWFHHGSVTAPILIAAALTVLADPPRFLTELRAPVRRLVPVGAAVAALAVASPLSPRAPGSVNAWRALGERHDTPDAIALVGASDGVSAGALLVPQLAHREDLHVLPLPFRSAGHAVPPRPRPGSARGPRRGRHHPRGRSRGFRGRPRARVRRGRRGRRRGGATPRRVSAPGRRRSAAPGPRGAPPSPRR